MLVDYRGALFIEDVGLTVFWAALQGRAPTVESSGSGRARATVDVTLSDALLPALTTEERARLAQRLQ